jgi:hypothetical protein
VHRRPRRAVDLRDDRKEMTMTAIRRSARLRPKFPVFMDQAEKYPVGSVEWSGRMSVRVHFEYSRADSCGFQPLVKELRAAVPGKPWLAWPPEEPWGTADRWARELVGLSWAKLMAIVREIDEPAAEELEIMAAPEMPAWGEVGNGRGRVDDVNSTQGGNSSSYLAARLKRDRPELAAEVEAGRMRLRDAARKAGIIKKPDTGRVLNKAWAAATPEQRAAVIARTAPVPAPDGLEWLRQAWREATENERAAFRAEVQA